MTSAFHMLGLGLGIFTAGAATLAGTFALANAAGVLNPEDEQCATPFQVVVGTAKVRRQDKRAAERGIEGVEVCLVNASVLLLQIDLAVHLQRRGQQGDLTALDLFLADGAAVPAVVRGGGCLGAAAYDRAEERKVQLLKAAGYNTVRTSHNPPSEAFLNYCDKLGLMVLDEAFDGWRVSKNSHDYSKVFDAWSQRDIESMVLRDRNHPSVIMWSIGNEIAEQGQGANSAIAKELAAIVHSEDPTRPVTAGCNNADAALNGFQTGVDVFGLNYNTGFFPRALNHPGNENKPMYSSESSSK